MHCTHSDSIENVHGCTSRLLSSLRRRRHQPLMPAYVYVSEPTTHADIQLYVRRARQKTTTTNGSNIIIVATHHIFGEKRIEWVVDIKTERVRERMPVWRKMFRRQCSECKTNTYSTHISAVWYICAQTTQHAWGVMRSRCDALSWMIRWVCVFVFCARERYRVRNSMCMVAYKSERTWWSSQCKYGTFATWVCNVCVWVYIHPSPNKNPNNTQLQTHWAHTTDRMHCVGHYSDSIVGIVISIDIRQ